MDNPNDSQKRLIIAIALSAGFMLLMQKFYLEPKYRAAQAEKLALAALSDGGTPSVDAGVERAAAPAGVDGGAMAQAPAAGEAFQAPVVERALDTPAVRYLLSSQGAGLVRAELRGTKEREQRELTIPEGYQKLLGKTFDAPRPIDLATVAPGQTLPWALSVSGDATLPPGATWAVVSDSGQQLDFHTETPRLKVDKRFLFSDGGNELQLDVVLTNAHSEPLNLALTVHLNRTIDPRQEQVGSLFGGIGNQSNVLCDIGGSVVRTAPTDSGRKDEGKGALSFIAVDQQYFLNALYPKSPGLEATCSTWANPTARSVEATFPIALSPGQATKLSFGGYLGPKDFELLKAVSAGPGHPALERSVDFGWWAVICKLLLAVLKLFHGVFGNWGVAIILLTLLVKLITLPLTHKMMVSAEQMKKLQPKMEELKSRFAKDQERLNQEMMKMYREAGVNPLGGCLPMLIQLPIWAALFTTLRTSYELYGEPFFGPIWTDLTYKDPTYLLPLALGVTMVVTQKLQPQMMDATQAKIFTWVMPVMFTAMMMNYPAGLSLYIFTNNVLSIVQQFALKRYLEHKGVAAPTARAT